MPYFQCVEKCFHKGRLYEPGDIYRDTATEVAYFVEIPEPEQPDPAEELAAHEKWAQHFIPPVAPAPVVEPDEPVEGGDGEGEPVEETQTASTRESAKPDIGLTLPEKLTRVSKKKATVTAKKKK